MDQGTIGLLVGGGVGLLGVIAGLAVPIMMFRGTFSRWTAVRPAPGTAPLPRDALLQRLIDLNDPRQPFSYRTDDRFDLRAEWRLADAAWWGFFQKNRLLETYLAKIYLHDRYREVRIVEERGRLQWTGGLQGPVPRVAWQRSFFRGIVLFERSREIAYGFREIAPTQLDRVVDYDFDVWRVKGPILRAAVEAGWTFCPVVFERHLTADRPLAG
ncbi:MAG: hypothetical protein M1582_02575 [Actinobacteria bacterium]|nr:hypothetical protein [Actinomycetota bacterium]